MITIQVAVDQIPTGGFENIGDDKSLLSGDMSILTAKNIVFLESADQILAHTQKTPTTKLA
jgi:hypothetical protein